jgi:hypothetical protein
MFDPVIQFFKAAISRIGAAIAWLFAVIIAPFVWLRNLYRRSGWLIRGAIAILLLGILVPYALFFWNAAWIRNFDPDYIARHDFTQRVTEPGARVEGQEGVCGTSAIVEISAELIDFNVNQNAWIPSKLLSKAGLFGIPWKNTPFMDNKAAFQLGINEILRRTTQEAVDRLGRLRGTSRIDQNLQNARQNIHYTEDLWYFSMSPFGPTTPTPSRYRRAMTNMQDFNTALSTCEATFDPRADNLLRFLDQMTNAIGSTSDILNDRMAASNAGWFDVRADDRFWFAYGQLYALNGILEGARSDFSEVVRERNLTRTWDEAANQARNALDIQPLIISNGSESAFIMPSHLATMGFYLLRLRANLTEIRDILDR